MVLEESSVLPVALPAFNSDSNSDSDSDSDSDCGSSTGLLPTAKSDSSRARRATADRRLMDIVWQHRKKGLGAAAPGTLAQRHNNDELERS